MWGWDGEARAQQRAVCAPQSLMCARDRAHCAHDRPVTVHCAVHCLSHCSGTLYKNTDHGHCLKKKYEYDPRDLGRHNNVSSPPMVIGGLPGCLLQDVIAVSLRFIIALGGERLQTML